MTFSVDSKVKIDCGFSADSKKSLRLGSAMNNSSFNKMFSFSISLSKA
jgi:hypothetical protein